MFTNIKRSRVAFFSSPPFLKARRHSCDSFNCHFRLSGRGVWGDLAHHRLNLKNPPGKISSAQSGGCTLARRALAQSQVGRRWGAGRQMRADDKVCPSTLRDQLVVWKSTPRDLFSLLLFVFALQSETTLRKCFDTWVQNWVFALKREFYCLIKQESVAATLKIRKPGYVVDLLSDFPKKWEDARYQRPCCWVFAGSWGAGPCLTLLRLISL